MQTLNNGAKGLELLIELNSDRLLYLATIAMALVVAGLVGAA